MERLEDGEAGEDERKKYKVWEKEKVTGERLKKTERERVRESERDQKRETVH